MVGQTLLNYRVTEKLGAGGQGAVYKAVDEKLGRTVVIKVLSPELTGKAVNLKRFEREARLASSLDHPNICTIYNFDEVGGLCFIVMQYVEGRNVRELVNGRPLELTSALSIAIQVTDALAAAHRRGIIHRDIKAGNVMVTDAGLVKVLDFGLAKLLDDDAARERDIHRTELTEIGVPYGTATYAAPEQARGDVRIDGRADIFSTGVLLYELLTGTWPFRGSTSVDVRHAVLHDEPAPIAASRDDTPPPQLQQILSRALAKHPDDRYQQIESFRDDLRRVLSAATSATEAQSAAAISPVSSSATLVPNAADFAAAQAAAPIAPRHLHGSRDDSFFRRISQWLRASFGGELRSDTTSHARSTTSARDSALAQEEEATHQTSLLTSDARPEARKIVAILPFRNLSDDPQFGFYEFSLADAVITELARLRSLVVRPSSLIAKYVGKAVDPLAAGTELRASNVLAASFLKAGERFRVTAQLLDVQTGDMLWSDRVDVSAGDIITVQDRIARALVEGLRIELSSHEREHFTAPTTNPEAYEEHLRGRDALVRFIGSTLAKEDFEAAVRCFTRAVELDPNFAPAHSGLGVCYAQRVLKGSGDCEDYVHAEQAFNRALALDPQLIEARLHMVYILLSRGEKQRARKELKRLRREAPNEAAVHMTAATVYRLDGKYEKALRSYDRAARINPAAKVVVYYNRARIFLSQARFAEAARELDKADAVEPDHPMTRVFRARLRYYEGDATQAARMFREVLAAHPGMDGIRPLLAACLIAQGDRAGARRELTDRVIESAHADHDIAYWLASAYALLSEPEEAFAWLERAIRLGYEDRAWLESNSDWVTLRDDPRFKTLMLTINKGE